MTWYDELIGNVSTLPAVGLAAVVMCGLLLAFFRVFGSRTPTSATDLACMVAVGAVAGRSVLLATPTLAEDVLALGILFALHRALDVLGRCPRFRPVLARPPLILISNASCARKL
jgi:uncharacterized membrane protein YcaP (DUF421 family)